MLGFDQLEHLYRTYNRACYIDQDPLRFLHRYARVEDREIAGLIASCLAFGNVRQIGASIERVLAPMGPSPRAFLERADEAGLARLYAGFRHRYTDGADLADLLAGIRRTVMRHGSLNACFTRGYDSSHATILPALSAFVDALGCPDNYLLPPPARGSACKRLHLYLRWMVRQDEVDPGGWTGIPPSRLLVPVDTHMARIARKLRLTRRRSADGAMALDITRWFARRMPEDPVRYDFALTRFGIHPGLRKGRDRAAYAIPLDGPRG